MEREYAGGLMGAACEDRRREETDGTGGTWWGIESIPMASFHTTCTRAPSSLSLYMGWMGHEKSPKKEGLSAQPTRTIRFGLVTSSFPSLCQSNT